MFVCCTVISAQSTDEWVSHLLYFICLHVVLLSQPNVQMNAFGICYILDVCVLTCYLSTRYRLTGLASGISLMFVCCPVISAKGTNEWVWYLVYLRCLYVVLLSQPKVAINGFGICYISDVYMWSCYHR